MRKLAIFTLAGLVFGTIAGCVGEREKEEASLATDSAALTPSCSGLPATCGGGTEDCCASLAVPAGVFDLGRGAGDADDCACAQTCDASCGGCGSLSCDADEKPAATASVSAFRLDRFEVTVGRFRKWVQAGAPAPAAGAGRHTHLGGGQLVGETGWDPTWPIAANFDSALFCSTPWSLWTSTPGLNENKPVNCVNWYEAYAFCVWDGGFLPTEAEWEYAATGGQERVYPWSVPSGVTTIDATHAVYACTGDGQAGCTAADMLFVGSKPAGAGRWGHEDQAGSMMEWVLDWGITVHPASCSDCYQATPKSSRVIRGGYWASDANDVLAFDRFANGPSGRNPWFGFRCARAPAPAVVEGTVTLDGAALGGVTVFVDLDSDATLDSGEPSTSSASGGQYSIPGVPAGTAQVRVINPTPSSVAILSPAAGYHTVTVKDGDVVTGLDFDLGTLPEAATVDGSVSLMLPNGTVLALEGATVFADLNANGALDAGEPSTTTSDPLFGIGGDYHLEGIPAGAADIRVVNPAPTNAFVVSPAAGFYALVVANGDELTAYDFVLEMYPPPATVQGSVVLDVGNGTLLGASGMTVFADLDGNGVLDTGEPSTVTEDPLVGFPFSGGDYLLEGIPAGAADIRIVNPSSDAFIASPVSGFHSVVVADGDALTGQDFVLETYPPPATVDGVVGLDAGNGGLLTDGGMTVFADLDGNGVLDPGEPSTLTTEPLSGSPFGGGEYHLEGIPAGAVDIRLVNEAPDSVFVAKPETGFHSLVVADGDQLTGYDFVLQPLPPPAVVEGHLQVKLTDGWLALLGDVTVFADLDGNGILDPGEPSDVSASATAVNPFGGGDYRLEGIPAGDVDIRVELPATAVPLDPDDGVHSITVTDGDVIELDFTFALAKPPADPGGDDDDGCAMAPHRVANGGLALGWTAFLLVAAVWSRRRRARA